MKRSLVVVLALTVILTVLLSVFMYMHLFSGTGSGPGGTNTAPVLAALGDGVLREIGLGGLRMGAYS